MLVAPATATALSRVGSPGTNGSCRMTQVDLNPARHGSHASSPSDRGSAPPGLHLSAHLPDGRHRFRTIASAVSAALAPAPASVERPGAPPVHPPSSDR